MNMHSYTCCDSTKPQFKNIVTLSDLLKVVTEENRLHLLCLLTRGTHCVCELMSHTSLSQSLISHHLKDLKDAGLIKDEKKGQWVHYSLTEKGKSVTKVLFTLIK
jgi:ArsR family transcriptional regulator, arsenate/arsenite/antimonite-responsive transcriptional repressor